MPVTGGDTWQEADWRTLELRYCGVTQQRADRHRTWALPGGNYFVNSPFTSNVTMIGGPKPLLLRNITSFVLYVTLSCRMVDSVFRHLVVKIKRKDPDQTAENAPDRQSGGFHLFNFIH